MAQLYVYTCMIGMVYDCLCLQGGGKTLAELAVFNRVRTTSALKFNELCW